MSGQKLKKGSADHRYLPRWEVQNRILYKLNGETQYAESESRDLSSTGVCLLTPQELPLHQKVKMKIYFEDDSSVQVEGEVVWNRPADGSNLAGVTFHNISQQAQELILKHAFELKKEDVIKHWFRGWAEDAQS